MDISQTTAPRSDQQNFDDYIGGPKTVTITEVRAGTAEQPVEVHLAEFPDRPFKPSKSMRRVLVAAWGPESSAYTGRRLTLFGDPTVKFGGATTGGIRISHLSHIDKGITLALTTTRGKRAPYHVDPLPAAAPPELLSEQTRAEMDAAFNDRGITDPNIQVQGITSLIGREVQSRSDITEVEAQKVIASLKGRAA